MNAVNAYAESSGALLLAEGIEDSRHLRVALGLGATLGQGWYFGRHRRRGSPPDGRSADLALPPPTQRRPRAPPSRACPPAPACGRLPRRCSSS